MFQLSGFYCKEPLNGNLEGALQGTVTRKEPFEPPRQDVYNGASPDGSLRSGGLGFRVWGLGFRVQGLGLRVYGLGYRT